ncbi:hypothetical protein [Baaleninema sp.]
MDWRSNFPDSKAETEKLQENPHIRLNPTTDILANFPVRGSVDRR